MKYKFIIIGLVFTVVSLILISCGVNTTRETDLPVSTLRLTQSATSTASIPLPRKTPMIEQLEKPMEISTLPPSPIPSPSQTPVFFSTPAALEPMPDLPFDFWLRPVQGDSALRGYNLGHGETLSLALPPEFTSAPVQNFALSSDHQYAAYSTDQMIYLLKWSKAQNSFLLKRSLGAIDLIIPTGLSFSPNNHYLAFNDTEGAKLLRLDTDEIILLRKIIDWESNDPYSAERFFPSDWSPDSAWISIIASGNGEFWGKFLVHLQSGVSHYLDSCYGMDYEWFNDSSSLVSVFGFSGYYGCGEDPGVHLLTLENLNLHDQRIYPKEFVGENWPLSLSGGSWCEGTALVLFEEYEDQIVDTNARIMLVDTKTGVTQTLSTKLNVYASDAVCLPAAEVVLITPIEGEPSRVISIDPHNLMQRDLVFLPGAIEILALIPDTDWVILGRTHNDRWDRLYLLDGVQGTLVDLGALDLDRSLKPLLQIDKPNPP